MKKALCLFILFFHFLSCGNQTSETVLDILYVENAIEHKPIFLDEFAQSVTYVPLETNKDILIRYISKIDIANNLLFVQHDELLSVFDMEGNFLYRIGSKGQGPNEYVTLGGFFIRDNSVYIVDTRGKHLYKYTLTGEFQEGIQLESVYHELFPLAYEGYLGFFDRRRIDQEIMFEFLDTKGNVEQQIMYLENYGKDQKIMMVFIPEGYVYNYDNSSYYKNIFNDTLYTIQPDHTSHPRLVIDLGRYPMRIEERYIITDMRDDRFQTKMRYPTVIGETDHYFFFTISMNRETKNYYWDKLSKELYHVKLVLPTSEDTDNFFIFKYISNDNTRLISYTNSDETDDNPVVVIAAIK
ncbi:6-bladed beta-propeller [Parabacteroides sp. OttesenSCG-928-G07]|nr:6-bladed beta-propeller [Parabacteroides sp. OttesenSCG-928-G07]